MKNRGICLDCGANEGDDHTPGCSALAVAVAQQSTAYGAPTAIELLRETITAYGSQEDGGSGGMDRVIAKARAFLAGDPAEEAPEGWEPAGYRHDRKSNSLQRIRSSAAARKSPEASAERPADLSDPICWIAFADNGYVRFWTNSLSDCTRAEKAHGFTVQPFTLSDLVAKIAMLVPRQSPAASGDYGSYASYNWPGYLREMIDRTKLDAFDRGTLHQIANALEHLAGRSQPEIVDHKVVLKECGWSDTVANAGFVKALLRNYNVTRKFTEEPRG